jgi:polygalacturonase
MKILRVLPGIAFFSFATVVTVTAESAPLQDDQQLPRTMHTAMQTRAHITVGVRDADMIGADNRVLQAAVDYVAGLGGGVVEIGPGEYLMRDSLHLRRR